MLCGGVQSLQQLGRQPRLVVNGMKVRATNTRLADVSKNTVKSQRSLRIDRRGRDRPCAEALEREVEDGHPTYKVPPTSLNAIPCA